MKKIILTAGAALFAMSTAASAALLSIDSGTAGTIPGIAPLGAGTPENNVLDDLSTNFPGLGLSSSQGGFYGANILADSDLKIKYELFGFEASFENSFEVGGSTVFDTETYNPNQRLLSDFGTAPSTIINTTIDANGLLDFVFRTLESGSSNLTAANDGTNPDNTSNVPNFFATFGGDGTATEGDVLYLFFDDGGADNDDNHDDLVIRLTAIEAVPVPAAAIPFLTALGAFGVVGARRRRKAKKA